MNLADLNAIVGEENVLSGAAAVEYSVAGVVPGAVVVPADRGEAARVIRLAAENGWALVPCGGGTAIDAGFPPTRLDLVLSTRRMNRVVDYQPDDMTVTVEPGVTLADLERTLAERGQILPLDPPNPERATVGGLVATAASGSWRAAFGTPRDWVIGCRVVGVDGQEVRGGGQVVKNVAGYDLPKLYTGSYGTLGLITEVTFKVMPYAGVYGYALVGVDTPAAAEELASSVRNSDLQPAIMDLITAEVAQAAGVSVPGGKAWALFLQFIHVPEAVRWQLDHLAQLSAAVGGTTLELAEELGDAVRSSLRAFPESAPLIARMVTTSGQAGALAGATAALLNGGGLASRVLAHAATGQVYAAVEVGADASLAEALRALVPAGGSCSFPRLPEELRASVDPWGHPGAAGALMRGIKETLDPQRVFSPGRFAGRI